ncbi:MAG: hypothetical protein FWC41_02305 [Firmicutes bacterium]|nr:hypothetical protein [Bacillota bacterium]
MPKQKWFSQKVPLSAYYDMYAGNLKNILNRLLFIKKFYARKDKKWYFPSYERGLLMEGLFA